MKNSDKKIYKNRSQIVSVLYRLSKNKLAMFGLLLLIFMVIIAIFADIIVDYDEMAIGQNIELRLQTPSKDHWFGTDHFGRDIFARIIHGSRISLSLGIIAMFIAVATGSIIGAVAGYYGGRIDNIIMRFMDILLAIPPILMSISIVAALGQSIINLLIALSIAYVPVFARVIRSSILSVKGEEFIEAAKACGTSDKRIIFKHIIPNAIGPIIVQATLAMGATILIISSLSFMGLGIKPPAPEWGTMLFEGRDFIRQAPYLILFPGAAITISVISLNLLGDGLRDALDPRLKD
ncbi:ABC transporter permease [Sedimentibacter sp. MB31-C6]|uniref:ABC transporter permease n=1 Tax=Sedimentibacter sp. MB31-C6 TaxID=3109366 RepID=UPI002DDCA535|nr:ABC transporter permease [Sedimentibacter sp. MB36-C1]WSI05228.1 ABC transporter permease [Sedimentibacter sp. MB36-C1]